MPYSHEDGPASQRRRDAISASRARARRDTLAALDSRTWSNESAPVPDGELSIEEARSVLTLVRLCALLQVVCLMGSLLARAVCHFANTTY
jgi:hypothetical protein